ncbi:MAG: coproporphyrinogen III oxidase [Methylococcaceae bacterium]|nr:coproporphyrinogen III oxidase [Methylococcaceae bacterium]
MKRAKAQSVKAQEANSLVESLQQYFVSQLNETASSKQVQPFKKVEWFRDEGLHGGGVRYEANNKEVFNRGSVNVSQIHYDDDSNRSLASATAISTIIHPENPYIPSIHMHISWTEMKSGQGYWRMMVDLNPAIENEADKVLFDKNIQNVTSEVYDMATEQGECYFFIPALNRHRGVSHFYLEEYNSGSPQADFKLAEVLGKTAIDGYIQIFNQTIKKNDRVADDDYKKQLAYHTLYLFQVLTLDRGTTSGLLVHNQNDVGIMGSLPAQIDKTLLSSWKNRVLTPQDQLVQGILDVLPDESLCVINEEVKMALAEVIRQHYTSNPQALGMLAQGNVVPETVGNHK